MQTRIENLTDILTLLENDGVKFRLIQGEFRAIPSSVPEQWDIPMEVIQTGLTLALRVRLGFCYDCGLSKACRPKDLRGAFTPPMAYKAAQWCDDCYTGRLERIAAAQAGQTQAQHEETKPPKQIGRSRLVWNEEKAEYTLPETANPLVLTIYEEATNAKT